MTTSTQYLSSHVTIKSLGFGATEISLVAVSDSGRLALGEVCGVRIAGVEGVAGCPVSINVRPSQLGDFNVKLRRSLRAMGIECWE